MIEDIKINKITIGINRPAFIIAEIGATHNGNLQQCLDLIQVACDCGAQAVKLQTVSPQHSYCQGTLSYEIFTKLSFSFDQLKKIKNFADRLGIVIFTTPGDFPSLKLAKKLKFPLYKVSSGLMTNYPLIEEIAKENKPIILSTGMAYMYEVEKSLELIKKYNKKVIVLHCVSSYPCKDSILNLKAIKKIFNNLHVISGFSDHSYDEHACSVALAMGAKVIEKHLALSDELAGPERGVACTPDIFKKAVNNIRRTEKMLGTGEKRPNKVETLSRRLNRRTVISLKQIKKGEKFSKNNISLMRGNEKHIGLDPDLFYKILGSKAQRDIKKNEPINIGMVLENI